MLSSPRVVALFLVHCAAAASGCDTSNEETSIYSYGMIAGCQISSPGRWKVRVDFNPTNNIVDLYFVKNNCDAKPWDNTARIKKWGGAVSETVEFDVTDYGSTYCFVLDNNNWVLSAVTYITLEWIAPTPPPPPPSRTPPPTRLNCAASAVGGEWKAYGYTNANSEFEYTVGTTPTDGNERTTTWSRGVEAKVSGGFKFLGMGVNVEVTGTYSQASSDLVSKAVQYSASEKQTYKFDKGGQVWQFEYEVEDWYCSQATIKTKNLVITESYGEPPCCLPGYAILASRQHGPCVKGSPCTCPRSVCEPTPGPTSMPFTPADALQDARQLASMSSSGASSICGVAGSTQACICIEGSGVQSCTSSGSWGQCTCGAKASLASGRHQLSGWLLVVLVALTSEFAALLCPVLS